MKYIPESFEKFKKDALSKIIYDILKYIIVGIIFVQLLKFIPVIKDLFIKKIEITVWLFISIILISILIVFILYTIRFQKVLSKIKAQNQIDDLTQIKNHKALDEDLDQILNSKSEKPTSLIIIDIDNFKKFNDDYNYEIADKILTKLGELLKRDCRITDEVYRYFFRGDEFLIIAQNTNVADGKKAAERKRTLIMDSNFSIEQNNYNLTVSCGVTELNKNDTKETLKNRLNEALLKAKSFPTKNRTEIML